MAACFDAKLKPGVDVALNLVGLDAALDGADLVFTAEGRLDAQTAAGKGPAGVAARARAKGVPCLAVAGGLETNAPGGLAALHALGMDAAFSLCPGPMPLEEALRRAPELLAAATEQAFRAFLAGRRAGREQMVFVPEAIRGGSRRKRRGKSGKPP